MPCYTLVQVTVKDLAMAEAALKALGEKATITKNSDGTFTVTPEKQSVDFKNRFLNEYAAQVATKKAKAAGYSVSRQYNQQTGETELTLRQY